MSEALRQAAKTLEGQALDVAAAKALARIPGEAVLDLISLANRVRNRYSPSFQACSILNVRSGACSENCRFCAQSGFHDTKMETYPLLSQEAILSAAEAAHVAGIRSFCIVGSGYGVTEPTDEFNGVLEAISTIHRRWPGMGVSASLGVLSDVTARLLAACGIEHYNINLQTAPERYRELIATTHSVEDRRSTIRLLKRYDGIHVCSGGILGVGETMDDRIALAFAVSELNVDIIPLNVLLPIEGTPLEGQTPVPAVEVAKTIALFRLINPRAVIKLAAGRETVMNDFQGLLMLAGANGFITGGYLTTRGREVSRDMTFIKELRAFSESGEAAAQG